jgi:hypothetical protein
MPFRRLLAIAVLAAVTQPARAADFTCNGLVPSGQRLICSGFEPNWAVVLACEGATMNSVFIDAFSGDSVVETPGSVTFATENRWSLSTSHGVQGTIAYTPGGCTDESDAVRDFTFTPTAAPGLSGPFFPFCCRME